MCWLRTGQATCCCLSIFRQRPNQLIRKKNKIRLKSAHRKAADELESAGATEAHCAASLDSLEPLLRAHSELWEHPGREIGIFIDDDDAQYVHLQNRIDEFVVATCYYHLKPLYAALPFAAPYFVLALSQNEVALFIGNGITLTRIELDPDVPQSLTDVIGDELTGRRLQHHGGNRESSAAIFHG